jgi:hypothetical protein
MKTLIENTVETTTTGLACMAEVEVEDSPNCVKRKGIAYEYNVTRFGIEDLIVWWEDGDEVEDQTLVKELQRTLEEIHYYDIIQEEIDYEDTDGDYDRRNDK